MHAKLVESVNCCVVQLPLTVVWLWYVCVVVVHRLHDFLLPWPTLTHTVCPSYPICLISSSCVYLATFYSTSVPSTKITYTVQHPFYIMYVLFNTYIMYIIIIHTYYIYVQFVLMFRFLILRISTDSFRPGEKAGAIQKKSDVNESSALKALSIDILRPFVPEFIQTVTKDGQCIHSYYIILMYTLLAFYYNVTPLLLFHTGCVCVCLRWMWICYRLWCL